MANSHAGTNEVLDPRALMQRVADHAQELIPGADGVLIGLSDGGSVTYVCGSGFLAAHLGTSVSLGSSLAGLAVQTGTVLRSDDTEVDPRVDWAAVRRLNVRSTVCVPLHRASETLGVLAVSAMQPHAFGDDDVVVLAHLADFLGVAVGLAGDLARVTAALSRLGRDGLKSTPGALLSAGRPDATANRFVMSVLRPEAVAWMEARDRVQGVLDLPELVEMAYQPIVDLASDTVVAVESLARFRASPRRSPDKWFNEAALTGLAVDLEMLAVNKALGDRELLPEGVALTLNVGPDTFVSPQLAEALASAPADQVVLELTEHTQFEDYDGLLCTLATLRRAGVRLSVDDAGAGFSGLSHILKLAPDFIKLDRELVKGLDIDPVRRALTSSLVSFAAGTGATIVAEGVETIDELEAVRTLGVRYAQGYYLARPGPIEGAVGWAERPLPATASEAASV